MAGLKTQVNDSSVENFIDAIAHPTRKDDALVLLEYYKSITGEAAKMWGNSIIGFGEYSYKNKNGETLTWMRSGFSPRKQYMSLYLMSGVERNPDLLSKLGKYKNGKSCLNINKLADVDLNVVKALIEADKTAMDSRYPRK